MLARYLEMVATGSPQLTDGSKHRAHHSHASQSSQFHSDVSFAHLLAYRFIATILFLHRPLYTFPKEPKIV